MVDYDIIDYIDITTTSGNASDRGDLTVSRSSCPGITGDLYGFICGGESGGYLDVIDYIDITTITGNAVDKGDLEYALAYSGGIG